MVSVEFIMVVRFGVVRAANTRIPLESNKGSESGQSFRGFYNGRLITRPDNRERAILTNRWDERDEPGGDFFGHRRKRAGGAARGNTRECRTSSDTDMAERVGCFMAIVR
jgi:hypothetical protein